MDEPDTARRLAELIEEKGEDMASLSRMLGRNPAYIQQFIKRGVPRKLDEADRRTLARYFGVDEAELGAAARELVAAPDVDRNLPIRAAQADWVAIPRLAIGASAGPGALVPEERAVGRIGFDPGWLRDLAPSTVANLQLIRVEGDSMSPTLNPGDDILVDLGDAAERLRDGIYVLRVDDALNVKRLAVFPQGRRFTIKSDNTLYPDWADCTPEQVTVVGRVLWAGRRL